jgi:hypothetical protein
MGVFFDLVAPSPDAHNEYVANGLQFFSLGSDNYLYCRSKMTSMEGQLWQSFIRF